MGRYWLVLCGTGSVSSGTGLVKGSYACIYRKNGDLVGCHHSRTDDVKERCSNSADGPWTAEMSKYLTSTFEPYLIYSRVICKSIPAEIVWMQQLPGKSIELSTYLSVRYPQKNSY